MGNELTEKYQELATTLAEETDTDIALYNGPIERDSALKFIDAFRNEVRRKNILLFLCTRGGDPDAAYLISTLLQQKYTKVSLFIAGLCKSAGTLLAVGAHELIMGDTGELGPLDIQLGKKDALWESDSGLTILKTIEKLEEDAFEIFERGLVRLTQRSGGRITVKTASSIASQLATGIIEPIARQIDPSHIGEVSRAMKIGMEYGDRLKAVSKNIKTNTNPKEKSPLEKLASAYPSHGFVINRKEAESLFQNVRHPSAKEVELLEEIQAFARTPFGETAISVYLSTWKKDMPQPEDPARAVSQETPDAHRQEEPRAAGTSREVAGTRTGTNGESPKGPN